MPINGDLPLFKITEFQTYYTQQCINVFWYRGQTTNFVTAAVVSAAFQSLMSTARRAISNPNWSSDTIEVDQVNDLTNFGQFTSYGAGTYTTGSTQDAQRYVAVSIRLSRTTKETRSGWKRLVGLSEGMIDVTGFAGAYLSLCNVYAALLDNVLVAGGENFDPVIIRQTTAGDPPVVQDPSLWVYNPILTTTTINRPTTQNSRKGF